MSTNTKSTNWVIFFYGDIFVLLQYYACMVGASGVLAWGCACMSVCNGFTIEIYIFYVPFWQVLLKYCFPHQNTGNSYSSSLGKHITPQLRGLKARLQCFCHVFDLIHGRCWKWRYHKNHKEFSYVSAPSRYVFLDHTQTTPLLLHRRERVLPSFFDHTKPHPVLLHRRRRVQQASLNTLGSSRQRF